MEYISDGRKFSLSYSELKEKYLEFIDMEAEEFMENIHDALHLAVIICFLKEIPTYVCLIDTGIIHELTHLLKGRDYTTTEVEDIIELFKETLELT